MATHSSVFGWRIPGMGKPGGLPSMGSHRVGHDWSDLAAAAISVPVFLLSVALSKLTASLKSYAAAAKSLQSCPTLRDPIDGSPRGSPIWSPINILKYLLFIIIIYFILFFNFTILCWFCHISTWICQRYTRVPHSEPSSLHISSILKKFSLNQYFLLILFSL